MADDGLILGVSGLRGIVGESLTPEVAVRYGKALGVWLGKHGNPFGDVVVGQDGRRDGAQIVHAVCAGLMSTGRKVKYIGIATTPTIGVAVDDLHAIAGVQITASHNPQEWNGVKVLVQQQHPNDPNRHTGVCAPPARDAEKIIELYASIDSVKLNPHGAIGSFQYIDDQTGTHLDKVERAMLEDDLDFYGDGAESISDHRFRFCADSVNASGIDGVIEFATRYGCTPIQLAGVDNGVFPHTPEPTRENLSGEGGLCDAVPGLKADVGFAQDPDADRLAIVDEKGAYIGEEYTLVIAALALLEARKSAGTIGGVLVANLSTSRMIDDVAAAYGARVERTAVGEANVVERMKALKAEGEDVVLGGEGNGGVIWPEVVYVRDSLGSMALTLALMARTGKTVSELVSWIDSMAGEGGGGGYTILKRKAPLKSKADARPAVEAIAKHYGGGGGDGVTGGTPVPRGGGVTVDLQDGVRVDWAADRAWVHVRASNTEPIMRLIAEAPTEGMANEILAEVEGLIG